MVCRRSVCSRLPSGSLVQVTTQWKWPTVITWRPAASVMSCATPASFSLANTLASCSQPGAGRGQCQQRALQPSAALRHAVIAQHQPAL